MSDPNIRKNVYVYPHKQNASVKIKSTTNEYGKKGQGHKITDGYSLKKAALLIAK